MREETYPNNSKKSRSKKKRLLDEKKNLSVKKHTVSEKKRSLIKIFRMINNSNGRHL